MQQHNAERASVFVWQSLVVEGYRSFFYKLVGEEFFKNQAILLVSPEAFIEQGGQKKVYTPFQFPFLPLERACNVQTPHKKSTAKMLAPETSYYGVSLPATIRHVQWVNFKGIYKTLKNFQSVNGSAGKKKNIDFYFIAEPYSFTALLLVAKVFLICNSDRIKQNLANLIPPWGNSSNEKMDHRIFLYTAQNLRRKMPLPLRLVQMLMFRMCTAILSCGITQHEVLRAEGFRKKILDFPLWFDSLIFNLGTSTHPRIRVAYTGSFLPEKGVEDFLDAIELLPANVLASVEFVFAGSGPLLAEVERKIDDLRFRFRSHGITIESLGALSQQKLAELFQNCCFLVVPSRKEKHWQEQFGRVIVEAQACGASVLATNTGEIPNVVVNKNLLFPERNPTELARLLHACICEQQRIGPEQNTEKRKRVAQTNLKFSDARCAERFAKAMQSLEF